MLVDYQTAHYALFELRGFRPHARGREACRASWAAAWRRDHPPVDAGGWGLEGLQAASAAGVPASLSARVSGGADPDRRFGALVVRGPWAAMHPARLH